MNICVTVVRRVVAVETVSVAVAVTVLVMQVSPRVVKAAVGVRVDGQGRGFYVRSHPDRFGQVVRTVGLPRGHRGLLDTSACNTSGAVIGVAYLGHRRWESDGEDEKGGGVHLGLGWRLLRILWLYLMDDDRAPDPTLTMVLSGDRMGGRTYVEETC